MRKAHPIIPRGEIEFKRQFGTYPEYYYNQMREKGYCREFCNLIMDINLKYCWDLVFARDKEEQHNCSSPYEWQEVTVDSGCPFYPLLDNSNT